MKATEEKAWRELRELEVRYQVLRDKNSMLQQEVMGLRQSLESKQVDFLHALLSAEGYFKRLERVPRWVRWLFGVDRR